MFYFQHSIPAIAITISIVLHISKQHLKLSSSSVYYHNFFLFFPDQDLIFIIY